MTAKFWVGLDVGEARTAICVVGPDEVPLMECSTGSKPLEVAQGLAGFAIADIGAVIMESGAAPELRSKLRTWGYPITVADPRKTHLYLSVRQHKTDTNDARGLAEIARSGLLSALSVHCRSATSQQLWNELITRRRLIQTRVSIRNSLRSMLRNTGSHVLRMQRGKSFQQCVEEELLALESSGAVHARRQMRPLLETYVGLTAYLKRVDEHLADVAEQNLVTRRFMQIPGVGPICAIAVYAAIDDPFRFEHSTDVGAYFGLVPRIKQSGAIIRRGRITKAGNSLARSYLFLAAGSMMNRATKADCAIRDWGRELTTRVGAKKARIAVARKLVVAMVSNWKADRDFVAYPQTH